MAVGGALQARKKVARGKCERSEARSPWILLERNLKHCKCDRKRLLLSSVALSELNIMFNSTRGQRFALAPGYLISRLRR